MHKIAVIILLLSSCLSGCLTNGLSSKQPRQQKLEEMDQKIVDLETQLSKKIAQNCGDNINALSNNVDALSSKLEAYKNAKNQTKIVNQCSNKEGTRVLGDKIVVGSVEKVLLTKEQLEFNARVDTGADASSLGVYGLQRFERDSKKWVRFSLTSEDDGEIYEYPIYDTVKIKQSSTFNEDRIEIKIDIQMGGVSYKKQLFNLADRSHLQYQLLIGRTFLKDIAVVDVSRKRLLRSN